MSVRNDQVNVTVEIDGKQAISNLGKLELSAKDIATELKSMKKGTDDYINTSKKLDNVNADIKKLRTEMGTAGMTINQMKNYQRDLNREMNNLTVGTTRYKELETELKQVNGVLADTRKGTKAIAEEAKNGSGFVTSFFGNFAANMAGKGLDFLKTMASDVFNVTANFQKLEAVLTNTLSSKSSAQRSLREIKDFAAVTPSDVQTLTESYVKLANQGFKPTTDELRKLGDLAYSTGKGFDQLTEAVIDAQTGEFERLKEFGIRAQKEGDKVTFTFKGVKTQTDFTNDSIRAYILSLGDLEGVSGAMAAISETLGGQVSNLGDSYDSLMNTIGSGNTGPIAGAIRLLNELVQGVEVALMTTEQIEKRILETAAKVNGERILKHIAEDSTSLLSVKDKLNKANLTEDEILQKNIETLTESKQANEAYIKTISEQVSALEKSRDQYKWGKEDKQAKIDGLTQELNSVKQSVAGQIYALDTLADKKKALDTLDQTAREAKAAADAKQAEIDKKNADKRAKDLEKEIDNLLKEWAKFNDEVEKFRHANELSAMDSNIREYQIINDKYDKLHDTALAKGEELLVAKLITEEELTAQLVAVEDLRYGEINAKQAEHAEADKLRRQALSAEIATEMMTDQEREEAAVNAHFDSLTKRAIANGIDTAALEQKRAEQIFEIRQKFREKELAADKALKDAQALLVTNFANLAGQTASFMEAIGAKNTAFAKAAALAQIAINSGKALSSAIAGASAAAAETGPAAPYLLGAYIAAGVGTVLGAFVQAKAVLAKAPTPTASNYGTAPAATSDSGSKGNSVGAYAAGGYTDIGTVSRGGYVSKPSIATFGEVGEEWVMPNWMLTNPRMANLVGVLEGVRMRGFADGGFTNAPVVSASATSVSATSGGSDLMMQLIASVNALRGDVRTQQQHLRAFVVYSDITDAGTTLSDIEKEASI